MGVPAFFRWLSRKYVSIIVDAVEERRKELDGVKIPVDCTQPNQNYQEFDNLYLDMNGIIHPCTHPEDRPAPKTEEEMFILIFEYIDRLFSIVRPRKLLYMAIDGVAPRAKMNQQRSRRFRASKEAAEKREQIAQIRKKLESEGIPLPPPRKEEEHFDSNCITPGTPFMARLADALRYYIHKRVTYDPAWQKIQVILSDANVPGEGEHKIMDYVRRQRASPSHDPNTVHCLCGADADLIMLGLATHEANFNIIREEFLPNQPRACELCGQYGHELEHCEGLAKAQAGPDQADPLKKEKNFIFIRLPVLREYLERELFMPNLPFPFDLERAIDDWVMMCFFVGNDFLPHLPSLEIRENAIDRLVKLYKNMVYQTGGWLTEDGDVNIERVKIIMTELGKVEDEIFKERQMREMRYKESQRQRKRRARENAALIMPYNASLIAPEPINSSRTNLSGREIRQMAADDRQQMERQAQKLKSLLTPVNTAKSNTSIGSKRKADDSTIDHNSADGAPPAKSFKDDSKNANDAAAVAAEKPKIIVTTPSGKPTPLAKGAIGALVGDGDESEEEPEDEIRLWEAGWKDRYYRSKFDVPEADHEFRRKVACAYTEGLSWVLKYYYQGCASWTWFYPYHYAPFASDFELIGGFHPDFSKATRPFKPLEQLMGVFPAASRNHIPEGWRWLMTDPKSPIIDFYPEDFEIDLNGKKYAWQGVALLPFVDEKRLLDALSEVYDTLTTEECARNMIGPDRLFVGQAHELFELLNEVHQQGKTTTTKQPELEETQEDKAAKTAQQEEGNDANNGEGNDDGQVASLTAEKRWILIDAEKAFGMAGQISYDTKALECGIAHTSMFRNSLEFGDIKNNGCIMVEFQDPQFPTHFRFKASRLDGIKELPRVLKPKDYDDRRQGQFRPQIGFTRDTPHASLSSAGHRTLNHHIDQYQRRSGPPVLQQSYNQSPAVAHSRQFHPQPQWGAQPQPLSSDRRSSMSNHHHQGEYYQRRNGQQPMSQSPYQPAHIQPLSSALPWHTNYGNQPTPLHQQQQQATNYGNQPTPLHQQQGAGQYHHPQQQMMSMQQQMSMPPPPLSFAQMALPPPPQPPTSWITQSRNPAPQGGYQARWGEPPPY